MVSVAYAWDPQWQPPRQPWGRPPGPPVWWAVGLWAVATLSLAAAMFLGTIAAAHFWYDDFLDNEGVTTTATVTEAHGSTITVAFATEDNYRATADYMMPTGDHAAVNDRIDITYDPEDTSHIIKAGSNEIQDLAVTYTSTAIFALAVAVGSSVGAVLVHRARGSASRAGG
jgi:hypothetical protein